ncbi:hypothetical protein EG328_008888 [Venturia inaequalis]|uniref:protein kinase C n=1 Tax=Venturia inaequalis TaxID=5025 RepID=A0A8H3YMX6_VENIN|nr:hypothetical protein EG328_008888 [Venturia inaequalis]RDI78998.1 hypothetical protein Vi05172_g11026 [Venturia inaequalis]
MNEDEVARDIHRKIEREKALITAANAMRQSTNNPAVVSGLDTKIRDGRRNIEYLESRLNELEMKRVNAGMEGMNVDSGNGGYGQPGYSSQYGAPGDVGHQRPPNPQFAQGGPNARARAPKPNYSKLDLIKWDTPHLGPRIQLMLSQLEFKLSVEKQYKDGIEKMVRLYQIEGDRKSKADAEARRIESNQKIQLLKQSLRRYMDLHVDIDDDDDKDDDSLNVPSQRKPLTGHLSIRIQAVADVDHAATGRFSRGPDTFVIIKVEDVFKGRTKPTKTDKWLDEVHEIDIDKANEIELTVYDRTGDHPMPIGMLWIRISDIVEEMRRKRIETEFNSSGWMTADRMPDGGIRPDLQFQPPPGQQATGAGAPGGASGPGAAPGSGAPVPQTGPIFIESWFSLEPVGRIHMTMSFVKQSKEKRNYDLGLGRKGAVRQKKDEVHEQYGHKFVQQQFYNVMRCALCGDFLKYAAGMQCADCKFTCHKKCYSKVVTKCITQSNAETDPDEAKINHRIPHRWGDFFNSGANWCCHCGYMLPLGRKQARKCSECSLTCHAQCTHFVPDFCGMSMEKANLILTEIMRTKSRQGGTSVSSMSSRTLRPSTATGRPTPPASQGSYAQPQGQDHPQLDQRYSYGRDDRQQQQPPQGTTPGASVDAARTSYSAGGPTSPTSGRPGPGPRTGSSHAAAAASAALAGKTASPGKSQGPAGYTRASTDYPPSNQRTSAGYGDPYPERGSSYREEASKPPAAQSKAAYNPADYAQVSGYPVQPYGQPAQPSYAQPPQQQQQSPYGQPIPQINQPPQAPEPPPQQAVVPAPSQAKVTPPANTQGTGRRIGLDHFNFLAVLGKGNFGKVMLAETKATKKLYAIKVLKKEFIIENDEVESTRSEKRVFLVANKERHPFLLNLHACFQTETRIYFVMEYISGGDLMLHIQRGQFGTKRAQFYAAEVCLALKYFHENGVIYRDLKLDNILLTLDGHIKIADYGLCKEDMWYGSTTSTFCGTPEFMAPEILLDKKYGRAVDWWAFGVLIYQMLLQQSPFRGEDEDEIYDAILADEPLYPIHMPRDSVSILQKLLTREPDQRLGSGPTDAQEIMSQPFFRNINWDDVYHKRLPSPYLPQITSATDTSNFDSEFTSVTPVLTPVQSVLSQAMQEEFRGFSYSADFV